MKIRFVGYAAQKGYPAIGLMRWVKNGRRTWHVGGFWVRLFWHRGYMLYWY